MERHVQGRSASSNYSSTLEHIQVGNGSSMLHHRINVLKHIFRSETSHHVATHFSVCMYTYMVWGWCVSVLTRSGWKESNYSFISVRYTTRITVRKSRGVWHPPQQIGRCKVSPTVGTTVRKDMPSTVQEDWATGVICEWW